MFLLRGLFCNTHKWFHLRQFVTGWVELTQPLRAHRCEYSLESKCFLELSLSFNAGLLRCWLVQCIYRSIQKAKAVDCSDWEKLWAASRAPFRSQPCLWGLSLPVPLSFFSSDGRPSNATVPKMLSWAWCPLQIQNGRAFKTNIPSKQKRRLKFNFGHFFGGF